MDQVKQGKTYCEIEKEFPTAQYLEQWEDSKKLELQLLWKDEVQEKQPLLLARNIIL